MDLDQTIIHTTNDDIPANLKDVYHFQVIIFIIMMIMTFMLLSSSQLYGDRSPWYHTRIRPGTLDFLRNISELYEVRLVVNAL